MLFPFLKHWTGGVAFSTYSAAASKWMGVDHRQWEIMILQSSGTHTLCIIYIHYTCKPLQV